MGGYGSSCLYDFSGQAIQSVQINVSRVRALDLRFRVHGLGVEVSRVEVILGFAAWMRCWEILAVQGYTPLNPLPALASQLLKGPSAQRL